VRKPPNTFSLIGPGRVGSSLAQALCEAGWRCATIVRGKGNVKELSALKLAFPESCAAESIVDLLNEFSRKDPFGDILFIAVQDDKITSIVEQLVQNENFECRGKVVFHVSGTISVQVLASLRERGASVGAFHPIAAFAKKFNSESARNIYYDFFGDQDAKSIARKITRQLKSRLLILKSEKERTLLHLAAAFASNSTVISVRSAERLVSNFIRKDDANKLMEGLLRSTLHNLYTGTGMESLTGPLKRGDVNVISQHLKALGNEHELLQFYKSWSLLGVEELLRVEHGAAKKQRLKQMKRILEAN